MKISSIIIAAAVVAAVLLITGCTFISVKGGKSNDKIFDRGNGVIVEKTFDIADFSKIELNVPADVEYEVAENASMSVKIDENLLELLEVTSEGGTLTISSTSKHIKRHHKLAITLTSSALSSIICNGAVDFECNNGISAEDFSVQINGAGDIDIDGLKVTNASFQINGAADLDIENLDAGSVSVEMNGAGDTDLSGKAGTVRVAIHGAGDVDLSNLEYENLVKEIQGVGQVKAGRK